MVYLNINFYCNYMFKNIFILWSFVFGYGYKMHSYLGRLTDGYLTHNEPELYSKVISLLNGQTIETVSSWADKIKRNKKYSWTKNLHYIDILECRKNYDKNVIDKYCNNSCIVSALQDFTNSIKYNFNYTYQMSNGYNFTNSELLKLIIHFVQDFSQPMHLLGYDRGGNSFKVNMFKNGKNISSNLHFIWDSMLPEYFVNNYRYTTKYNIYEKPDNYYNLLKNILNDNIHISCRIYPESHYLVFDEYYKQQYFVKLFDNYEMLIVSTLKYIFT